MTETAFRVAVTGTWDDSPMPPATATEIKDALDHYGFEGVTVTPMDDALIKAAENAVCALEGLAEGLRDPWTHYRPRPLDPTKIDYRIKPHTSASQLCTGVYPVSDDEAADRAAVLSRVKGTFGGRFNKFGGGVFEYVAYTD